MSLKGEFMSKVGILGAGAWGTAIGKAIADKGHDVVLWSFEREGADDINLRHINRRYLPNAVLPDNITATTNILEAASEKEFLILASPSLFILKTVKDILSVPNVQEGRSLIGVITKGFLPTPGEPKLIVETIENFLPGFYKNNVVYISGPSHAEEVVMGKITGLISACPNLRNSIRFRELLNGKTLRVFSSMDVIGVQVCAALKNVVAIAFGMMDALKEDADVFGDNTESLLLAAGLNEIQTLGRAMGATHPETFTSIAGVGDLDVTCRSQFGRNRRFGREIILKNILEPYTSLEDLISHIGEIGYLPEGIVAALHAQQLTEKHKLKLSVIPVVFKILNKELQPHEALRSLIAGDVDEASFTTEV
jgi:glycerol-3-phosphate dehydrogenase (NAD(P)+)